MRVDASAALGVIWRKGIGKLRQFQTGALWIQEQQLRNVVAFQKISGLVNPADLFTKHLSRECIDKYVDMLGAVKTEGRSEKAAQLHQLQRKVRQLRSQVRHKETKSIESVEPGTIDTCNESEFIDHVAKVDERLKKVLEEKFEQWKQKECRMEGISRRTIS